MSIEERAPTTWYQHKHLPAFVMADGEVVAEVWPRSTDKTMEDIEPVGRLVSATPDLLAALEQALPALCSCGSPDCVQYGWRCVNNLIWFEPSWTVVTWRLESCPNVSQKSRKLGMPWRNPCRSHATAATPIAWRGQWGAVYADA